jgi:PiT family inorganic phosphate transporter
VDAPLVVAVLLAIGFAVTNGLHDASNAIATLVATRAATRLQAILLASVFNLLGPLFLGAAVADTIGGIVTVPPDVTVEVIGAGLAAAVTWLSALREAFVTPIEPEEPALAGHVTSRHSLRAACTRSTGAGSSIGGPSACSGF